MRHTATYSRRTFLAAAAMGLAGCQHWAGQKPGKRPNVLFIAVDDLRPQLGCYGRRTTLSPNIDRLAAEGCLFERTYCQVPVCGASRASLLTGLLPTRDRFVTWFARADSEAAGIPSLPRHLRDHGYYTVSNAKVFHAPDDSLDAWCERPWHPPMGSIYWRLEASRRLAEANAPNRGPAFEAADEDDLCYPDGQIAEKAMSDLCRLGRQDQPFFLAVGFYRPHLPFNAPKRYWDLYDRDEIDLADNPFRPKGAPDAAMHTWGELRQYTGIPQEGPLSEDTARTLIHGYYACVSYVDAQVGKLLDELERLGLREDTIVVLWGDHGWQLGEHGLWCKHCNFETALHAPFIVRAPNSPGGIRTDALTEYVDIYPTLTELCGLLLPNHLHGTSLVPLIHGRHVAGRQAAYSRYHNGDSLRTNQYRYTEWRDKNGECYARMLYDHNRDPHENVNIAAYPANRELTDRLSAVLHEQMARAGDAATT